MNKIKHIFLMVLVYTSSLLNGAEYMPYAAFTGSTVVPNDEDYYKYKQNNVEIIYTKNNLPFARHTAGMETPLHEDYEYFYNWKLDETLYVGLISESNQIANGFSTQWTNNRQINYMGGAEKIDYFTSTSWLNTLLYHETAHNYQYNVKGNVISRALHSVFGNGEFLLPLPYIIIPNIMENSFMLEGNAVLNESWHGNGGRLYSGRFKIQTILQAQAGNIKPGDVYNAKIAFPYGEIPYILGGFYNLYMAQTYGLEKLNSYFRYHSQMFIWPQLTNSSMRKAVGVSFEQSLEDFAQTYAKMGEDIVLAKGEYLARSQFFYPLNNDNDEIFFITNPSGLEQPLLVVYDKNIDLTQKTPKSFLSGKLIKSEGEYYTQGSNNVSPTKIYQGLFDSSGFIKESTASKMIQGYLSNGEAVYFDVKSSFSQAQLYVGDTFYAQVNSSVLIDKDDNLYYFVQSGKTRTLYKNKTPLYAYEGFYGIPSDVDSKGAVYFIANSENGSTLYRYDGTDVTRAHKADNIINAKIINNDEVLIAAIGSSEYYYLKNKLETIEQAPYNTRLFFEDKEYYGEYKELKTAQKDYADLDLSDPYYSLLDMHYSGTELFLGANEYGVLGSLNIKFGDPLSQNSVAVFASRDDLNTTIAGVSYANATYILEYQLSAYGVIDAGDVENARDYGVVLSTNLPLYRAGYFALKLGTSYYQDYDELQRDPLSVRIDLFRAKSYGVSMYHNNFHHLSIYSSQFDEDLAYGASYSFKHDLLNQFYIGLDTQYSTMQDQKSGIKVSSSSYQLDNDPTTVHISSLDRSLYFNNVGFVELNLAKVLNYSSYWFTFPFSLQRESIYTKYRRYFIEDVNTNKYNFNEITLGFTLASVMLNKLELPLSFEYIYNDADFIKEKNNFKFTLGVSF